MKLLIWNVTRRIQNFGTRVLVPVRGHSSTYRTGAPPLPTDKGVLLLDAGNFTPDECDFLGRAVRARVLKVARESYDLRTRRKIYLPMNWGKLVLALRKLNSPGEDSVEDKATQATSETASAAKTPTYVVEVKEIPKKMHKPPKVMAPPKIVAPPKVKPPSTVSEEAKKVATIDGIVVTLVNPSLLQGIDWSTFNEASKQTMVQLRVYARAFSPRIKAARKAELAAEIFSTAQQFGLI